MLFSAGMGIGLVFYGDIIYMITSSASGPAEPLYNYVSPPHVLYGESKDVAFERTFLRLCVFLDRGHTAHAI